jgi:hypothetical protein
MKGKQLALLLVAVVVLGAAWLNLSKKSEETSASAGRSGSKVVEFPLNEVARLTVKSGTAELNLVKKDDVWTVQERGGYVANFDQISSLLRKLWELKTVQEIKVGESQLSKLELIEPGKGENAGTLVQFLGADGKELAGLIVGKKHLRKSEGGAMDFGGMSEGFPAGRYLKATSAPAVSLVSDTLDEIDATPTRWILTDFINVEGPKTVSVTGPNTWTVSRESATAEWQLQGAKADEKLDASKVAPLSSLMASTNVSDVLAADTKVDFVTTATVETFDGFKYVLKIGKEEGDGVPVTVAVSATLPKERTVPADEKPEDKAKADSDFAAKQAQLTEKLAKEKKFESRAFSISKGRIDALLKERKSLIAEPPPEAPKAEAPKAEAPKAEAPKAEAPKVEAPKVEAPKVEVPKVEAPKVEAPKVEAPKAEAPKAEAPKAEAPKAEAPKVEAPKVEAPKVEAPKAEAPKAEAPKVEGPKAGG